MIARGAQAPDRRQWLLVAVLLALASALVPALFPSGSPMARPHGSAFDPTTSTVTLRVRDATPRQLAAPPSDARPRAQAPQVPLVLAAALFGGVGWLFLSAAAMAYPMRAAPAPRRRRFGPACARAPPARRI